MYYKQLLRHTAALLLAALLIQGCAAPAPKVSSALSAAGISLEPDPKDTSLLWWEAPGFSWHQYHRILLAPVRLDLSEENMQAISAQALQGFVDDIRPTLVKTLAPEYTLATEKGPGILELRITLIEIETANPAVNLATTLAVFVPLDMGGAALQAEFFDTLTGKRVAAMADRKTGTPLKLMSGFSRLGHANAAVSEWARELKTALAVNP